MENKRYTITIYTENEVGLLSRITAIFTRRHINIKSLNVSETERKGISLFTFVIEVKESMVITITKQINRIVEVIHAEYYEDADLICSQVGLFKVELDNPERMPALEAITMQNGAKILCRTKKCVFLENTGNRKTLEGFLDALKAFGKTEYVRSGRVAMTVTDSIRLSEILEQLADLNSYPNYKLVHPN